MVSTMILVRKKLRLIIGVIIGKAKFSTDHKVNITGNVKQIMKNSDYGKEGEKTE